MIHIDPASSQFEALPRQEQARIYAGMGWTIEDLMDEFGVSHTTIKRWTIPGYAEKQREYVRAWQRTDHGKEVRRRNNSARASLRSQSKEGR